MPPESSPASNSKLEPDPFISLVHTTLLRRRPGPLPFNISWLNGSKMVDKPVIAASILDAFWTHAGPEVQLEESPCRVYIGRPSTCLPEATAYSWLGEPRSVSENKDLHVPPILDDVTFFIPPIVPFAALDWALRRLAKGSTLTLIEPNGNHEFWLNELGLESKYEFILNPVKDSFEIELVDQRSTRNTTITVFGLHP